MKQQKKPEKTLKHQAPIKQTEQTIKYGLNVPENRDPQPKDYDEIEY